MNIVGLVWRAAVIAVVVCLVAPAATAQSSEEELNALRQQLAAAVQAGNANEVIRLSDQIEALERQVAERREEGAFQSDAERLLEAYRIEMSAALERGDMVRVREIAEDITRIEAALPVTTDMLEGSWELSDVLRNGVSQPDLGSNRATFTFSGAQSYRKEVRAFLEGSSEVKFHANEPMCGLGLYPPRFYAGIAAVFEGPLDEVIGVQDGRYEITGREVHLSNAWGEMENAPYWNIRRPLTMAEDGSLVLRLQIGSRKPGAGLFSTDETIWWRDVLAYGSDFEFIERMECDLVFSKVPSPTPWDGYRFDVRQVEARGPVRDDLLEEWAQTFYRESLCGSSIGFDVEIVVYAIENALLNDSYLWFGKLTSDLPGEPFPVVARVAAHCSPELLERVLEQGLSPSAIYCTAQAGGATYPIIEAVRNGGYETALKRPRFSWTRIKGESNVQGGGGNGSVEGRGTGRGIGADGGSPEGDWRPCRRGGGRGGRPGAGAAVERQPEARRGAAAAAWRIAGGAVP